jgi:hypothetical protein
MGDLVGNADRMVETTQEIAHKKWRSWGVFLAVSLNVAESG